MKDPVTEDLVAEWCEDVLSMWLTDYTDSLEDGRQRKIVELEDADYRLFEVRDYDGYHEPGKFRIGITVEEVK